MPSYVVAPSGGDFACVRDALAFVKDGDAILLRAGTYPEGPSLIIPPGVTLAGYPGDARPVIACANGHGATLIAYDRVHISGLEVRGVYDLGMGDLFYDVNVMVEGRGVVIENNLLSQWSHCAIKMMHGNGDGLTIRNNIIGFGGHQLGDHAIYVSAEVSGGAALIENNVIHDSMTYAINGYHNLTQLTIRGNVIYNNNHGGILIDHVGHRIYNNTICYNGLGQRGVGGGYYGLHLFHYELKDLDVRNNIVWGNTPQDIGVDISDETEALVDCVFRSNLRGSYYCPYPPYPVGPSDIVADPLFLIAPPRDWPDFRLLVSSPASSAGEAIEGVNLLDFTRTDWPVSKASDGNLGAWSGGRIGCNPLQRLLGHYDGGSRTIRVIIYG